VSIGQRRRQQGAWPPQGPGPAGSAFGVSDSTLAMCNPKKTLPPTC